MMTPFYEFRPYIPDKGKKVRLRLFLDIKF